MSFLAPLYLAGLAALALPLLFHLIRRTPRGKKVFSTLMFLTPSPPRLTRRSRLDHFWLLFLRAAALILLALAFARPYFRSEEAVASEPRANLDLALLLDTSASMRREGVFERALASARAVLAEAEGLPCLYTFHDRLVEEVGPRAGESLEPDVLAALVEERLNTLEPTWFASDLGMALVGLADRLDEARGQDATRRARIVVVSDLQEGSTLDALASYEWPAGIDLELRVVPAERGNVTLQHAPAGYGGTDDPEGLWVRVASDTAWTGEPLRLRWRSQATAAEGEKETRTFSLPPGESRVLRAPDRAPGSSAEVLVLEGDLEPFDNELTDLPDRTEESKLFLAGDDSEGEEGLAFYLRKVFADRTLERVVFESWNVEESEAEESSLLVFSVRSSTPGLPVAALEAFASAGGTVLLVLAEPLADEAARRLEEDLRRLLGDETLAVSEAELDRGHALLAKIDFDHPVFAPFDHPRYADFTRIRIWRHRDVTHAGNGLRVVVRFDDGSPFWLERPLGDGHLALLTSGWHPRDSDLARSSKFAPLAIGMHERSRRSLFVDGQRKVGDEISLATLRARDGATLVTPDGRRIALEESEDRYRLDRPGVHVIERANARESFSVRLEPREGLTEPLDASALERLSVPLTTKERERFDAQRTRQQNVRELESDQSLWRAFLIGALCCLLAETLLARRIATRIQETT